MSSIINRVFGARSSARIEHRAFNPGVGGSIPPGPVNRNTSYNRRIFFVIEHLEYTISKWLYIEYEHASKIVGKDRLIFTNIKKLEDSKILSDLGFVKRESFTEIFDSEKIIILDPKAPKELKPEDFKNKEAVIIGGILGDHPPRGRTQKLITAKVPKALSRNIGDGQFSIDGAVYVAKFVSEGNRLKDIPIEKGLHIRLGSKAEIFLPYFYPLKDGKPVISEKLIKYLTSNDIVRDEERLLKGEINEKENADPFHIR